MKTIQYKHSDTVFDYRLTFLENRWQKRRIFAKWYREHLPRDRQEEVWDWLRYEIATEISYKKYMPGVSHFIEDWSNYKTERKIWDLRHPEGNVTGFANDTYYSIRTVQNSKPFEKSELGAIDDLCRRFLAKEMTKIDSSRRFFAVNIGQYDKRRIRFIVNNRTSFGGKPAEEHLRQFAKGEIVMMASCIEILGAHVGALRCLAGVQKILEPYVKTEIRYHGCIPDSGGHVLHPFNKKIWDDTYFTAATYRRQSWFWFTADHIWFAVNTILRVCVSFVTFLIIPVPGYHKSKFFWCATVLWPHRFNSFAANIKKHFI